MLTFLRLASFVLVGAAYASSVRSQTPATPLSDLGGVVSPLDTMGDIIPGMSTTSPTADIEWQRQEIGDPVSQRNSGVAHYDISALNPDGIFSARLSGNVHNQQPGSSTSGVRVEYIGGNGSVQASDADAPILSVNQSGDRTFFSPSTSAIATYDFDVTAEAREAGRRGATSFGVRYEAENFLGSSVVTALDPGTFVVDEYHADPFSSLQPIIGPTGFSFRGHAGESITQGQSILVTEQTHDLTAVLENANNRIRIDWAGNAGEPLWSVRFASSDGTLLQPGDSFDAMRESFQDPGVAGLAFIGDGRGHNTLAGEFTIHDVAYSGNAVTRLDASFKQWFVNSNGITQVGRPTAFGRVQVNVTAVPEPASFVALAFLSACFLIRRRRKPHQLMLS